MTLPILHHFDASPFSEKIRLLMGYKQLTWGSVQVPRIMPKPALVPLTGGYRRTPVMQLGRDIYCDTALIARTLERRQPSPTLLPPAQLASIAALEQLADRQLFLAAVPLLLRPAGRQALVERLGEAFVARFQQDRAELFASGSTGRPDEAFSRQVLKPTLALLEAQLTAAPFMLGVAPTLADFALYHPIWYLRHNPAGASELDGHPRLLDWYERMAAFGHGRPQEMPAQEALTVAAGCRQWQPLPGDFDCTLELAAGRRVAMAATDYGTEPVTGELIHVGPESMTLARHDETIGVVRVHFPRQGFAVCALD
ncbi:glutathione S-transferase [Kushneria sinocarnis]|uniref:Glutathione S-transferase n=1 Tax=Kushneria sinocarnis TaxID=595502 RepID=A0A420X1J1_9GAMM|nr:glutathione S-transferase family protein [Kushneria sinocarnis]RKR07569.1 glutathione S-transferase [Kushneria sinocarnis]